jgi:hypothetical protein
MPNGSLNRHFASRREMEDAGIAPSRHSGVERHLGREVDGTQSSNGGRRGGAVEVLVGGGWIRTIKSAALLE